MTSQDDSLNFEASDETQACDENGPCVSPTDCVCSDCSSEDGSDLEPVLFQVVVSISFDPLNFYGQVDDAFASEGRATVLSKFHRGCKKYLSISTLCTV